MRGGAFGPEPQTCMISYMDAKPWQEVGVPLSLSVTASMLILRAGDFGGMIRLLEGSLLFLGEQSPPHSACDLQ